MLRARHLARTVLAGDQPALLVARVTVGVVRRLPEDADLSGFLLPFQDAVIRDIAPQKRAELAEPDRAFAPAAAGIKPFDRGIHRGLDRVKPRVECDDGGIG